MQETVRRMILKNHLVQHGDRVLVAVSGGPDSLCLLHLLHELAPDLQFVLAAAHLDHALRPESGEEADFVRRFCVRLAIPLTVERVEVSAVARRRRLGLEEAAREVRRAFLRETAVARNCRLIALGHHRGDQAETVLHRLLRGSGPSGLAGMRPQEGPFIRPLLEVSRRQILAYLENHNLPWLQDPSNRDQAFTRNRLRHDLLPQLQEFNPRIEEHLARLAWRLALEEEFWQEETEEAFTTLARFDGESVCLDRLRLLGLHPAMRARVLRETLRRVRGNLRGLAAVHLEGLETLLQNERTQADCHLPGAWAGRRYDQLWVRPAQPPEPVETLLTVTGPGTYPLPGGELLVSVEPAAQGEGAQSVEFDPADIRFPLVVRRPRPGDRFRPAGLGGSKKLKDFFIDAKLDRESRRRVLLVEGEEIIWLIGIRRCDGWRPLSGGEVLRLRFRPAGGRLTNHL